MPITFSGFVERKSGHTTTREWIGCGTEDELHATYIDMQDDCVKDRKSFPGKLVVTPATDEEVEKFRAEVGDWIPPHKRI